MRAISLWQPWASLMACHAKTIETRGYSTQCRGLVAIHAAQKMVHVDSPTAGVMVTALDTGAHPLTPQEYIDGLPRGVVVAVVEIYGCITAEEFKAKHPHWHSAEKHFGDFTDGRFAWLTRNSYRLKEPVECKGKQGFFFLPADVEKAVQAQL
jgi:activating signal cointegrator 1